MKSVSIFRNAPPSPNDSVLTHASYPPSAPSVNTVLHGRAARPTRAQLLAIARRCEWSVFALVLSSVTAFCSLVLTKSTLAGFPMLAMAIAITFRGIPLVRRVAEGKETHGANVMFMCLMCLTAAVMTFFLWAVIFVTVVYTHPTPTPYILAVLVSMPLTSSAFFFT
ncbi:putative transmembrane protein [Gregarina niphandrodes]|uniref:Transmembrane protein n=1 Tax=Gregarina niphandrodes TaxID=110365 RepID=A0A023B656_GRENI|nr:putative transmembrane protein [Gregarina niphandrodes]EZG65162.1 putative transmembrane protein [Gregarina niphandrodes]|eukprot:XP_011134096.1 putative transmembrane protein [Gregarina niphandrodes]